MNKKGVSLTIMIITVLVMMLIAGAVVINMVKHNPITTTKKTKLQVDMKNYMYDLDGVIKERMEEDVDYDKTQFPTLSTYEEIRSYFPTFDVKYIKYVVVKDGEFKIKKEAITNYPKVTAWLEEIGMKREEDIIVPDGFVHLEGTKESGLVIKDTVTGNEWVWVPVENIFEFKRTVSKTHKYINSNLFQRIEAGEKENSENFIEFEKSVQKHKGFFIGRYETSYSENRGYRVVKNGGSKYATVTSSTMNNAILKASVMYENSDIVKCSIISGTAYDYTMKWIAESNALSEQVMQEDASGRGLYVKADSTPSDRIPTGSVEAYKINNIYDLAGNCLEGTLERDGETGNYINRGGSAGHAPMFSYLSRRAKDTDEVCPRLVLYFK